MYAHLLITISQLGWVLAKYITIIIIIIIKSDQTLQSNEENYGNSTGRMDKHISSSKSFNKTGEHGM